MRSTSISRPPTQSASETAAIVTITRRCTGLRTIVHAAQITPIWISPVTNATASIPLPPC